MTWRANVAMSLGGLALLSACSEATATPATGFTSVIDTVDDNGAKPSLAVDGDGVPHIAYLIEAMTGFVNHAVLPRFPT